MISAQLSQSQTLPQKEAELELSLRGAGKAE